MDTHLCHQLFKLLCSIIVGQDIPQILQGVQCMKDSIHLNKPSTPADIRRPLLVAKVPQHASGGGFWICQLDGVFDESSIQTPFHALDSKVSHSTISHKFIILLQSLIAAISTAKRKCTFSSTAIVRPKKSHCSCCKSSHHCAKLRKQLSKRLLKFHLCWKVRSLAPPILPQTNAKHLLLSCAPFLPFSKKKTWMILAKKHGKVWWFCWTLRLVWMYIGKKTRMGSQEARQWGRPQGSPFHALGAARMLDGSYCWCCRNPANSPVEVSFNKGSYIPGGLGFLPSTVCEMFGIFSWKIYIEPARITLNTCIFHYTNAAHFGWLLSKNDEQTILTTYK